MFGDWGHRAMVANTILEYGSAGESSLKPQITEPPALLYLIANYTPSIFFYCVVCSAAVIITSRWDFLIKSVSLSSASLNHSLLNQFFLGRRLLRCNQLDSEFFHVVACSKRAKVKESLLQRCKEVEQTAREQLCKLESCPEDLPSGSGVQAEAVHGAAYEYCM